MGLNEKLTDMLVFCRPAAEYGWLETLPPPAWSKSHNAGIWAAAGKLKFGLHDLKCIISGGALHLEPAAFLRQIRVMARRDKVLRQAGMQHEEGTLGRLLRHQLQELGWRLQQGKWKHDLFEQGFRMPQVLQEADWGRIAHALRDSWRRLMYSRMQQSARHELAGKWSRSFARSGLSWCASGLDKVQSICAWRWGPSKARGFALKGATAKWSNALGVTARHFTGRTSGHAKLESRFQKMCS